MRAINNIERDRDGFEIKKEIKIEIWERERKREKFRERERKIESQTMNCYNDDHVDEYEIYLLKELWIVDEEWSWCVSAQYCSSVE